MLASCIYTGLRFTRPTVWHLICLVTAEDELNAYSMKTHVSYLQCTQNNIIAIGDI